MALGKPPVPGRPTISIRGGQGPTALAVGAGGGCLDIFTLDYPFSPLSPSLWETARYRLKYCLKGPLNPKQPTNQLISSRISSSLTPLKSGQRTTPLQELRELWRDTCTLKSWNFCKRNRLSICFLFVYSTSRSPERSFLCFLAHQPCRSRLSQLQKETDLTLTFLLVNVSLGSAEKLKTSVDYVRSLTCQNRFHVAVSVYFMTLWGLKMKKP